MVVCNPVIPNESLITWAISFPSDTKASGTNRTEKESERDGGRDRGFGNVAEV